MAISGAMMDFFSSVHERTTHILRAKASSVRKQSTRPTTARWLTRNNPPHVALIRNEHHNNADHVPMNQVSVRSVRLLHKNEHISMRRCAAHRPYLQGRRTTVTIHYYNKSIITPLSHILRWRASTVKVRTSTRITYHPRHSAGHRNLRLPSPPRSPPYRGSASVYPTSATRADARAVDRPPSTHRGDRRRSAEADATPES